jgi:hypothetical protein
MIDAAGVRAIRPPEEQRALPHPAHADAGTAGCDRGRRTLLLTDLERSPLHAIVAVANGIAGFAFGACRARSTYA